MVSISQSIKLIEKSFSSHTSQTSGLPIFINNKSIWKNSFFCDNPRKCKGKHFVTKIRQNMKSKLMALFDKLLLKKRGVIESVGTIFKEELSLEYSLHRSIFGFFYHVISSIAAYNFKPKTFYQMLCL